MSAYLHFFIKVNDIFVPIGTYSRSTETFKAFEASAPWEKAAPVTKSTISDAYDYIEQARDRNFNYIANLEEEITFINTTNAPLGDKLEELYYRKQSINEARENNEALERAEAFITFIKDIKEEIEYATRYEENFNFNSEYYIYYGIECGYSPEVD